jgi:site-specific recombinase XerD
MRKYLKDAELKALLEAPTKLRDKLLLKLLYETGMRIGEVSALNISDVDFESGCISIQRAKRHKEGRIVPLVNSWTVSMLRAYIGSRRYGPVFMSQKGNALSRRQIEALFDKYAKIANLDEDKSHPHVLRHSHAVSALKAGLDLNTLKENLGHTDIQTTAIYTGLDPADRISEYRKKWNPEATREAEDHDKRVVASQNSAVLNLMAGVEYTYSG